MQRNQCSRSKCNDAFACLQRDFILCDHKETHALHMQNMKFCAHQEAVNKAVFLKIKNTKIGRDNFIQYMRKKTSRFDIKMVKETK